jgi:hypothetical protein
MIRRSVLLRHRTCFCLIANNLCMWESSLTMLLHMLCPHCCCTLPQPLLDVLLFTHSLSKVMGYKGQLGLYAYYVFVAWLLRAIAPPLASMTAQESALVGSFRCEDPRQPVHQPVQQRVVQQPMQAALGLYGKHCGRASLRTAPSCMQHCWQMLSSEGVLLMVACFCRAAHQRSNVTYFVLTRCLLTPAGLHASGRT